MPEASPPGLPEPNVIKIPVKRVMDILYIVLVAFVLLIVYLTYPRSPQEEVRRWESEVWQATKPATTQPFIEIQATKNRSTGEYKFPVVISVKDDDNTFWTFRITGSNPSTDIVIDHLNPDGRSAGWVPFNYVPKHKPQP